jgi:hypothetical protein
MGGNRRDFSEKFNPAMNVSHNNSSMHRIVLRMMATLLQMEDCCLWVPFCLILFNKIIEDWLLTNAYHEGEFCVCRCYKCDNIYTTNKGGRMNTNLKFGCIFFYFRSRIGCSIPYVFAQTVHQPDNDCCLNSRFNFKHILSVNMI